MGGLVQGKCEDCGAYGFADYSPDGTCESVCGAREGGCPSGRVCQRSHQRRRVTYEGLCRASAYAIPKETVSTIDPVLVTVVALAAIGCTCGAATIWYLPRRRRQARVPNVAGLGQSGASSKDPVHIQLRDSAPLSSAQP